MQMIYIGSVCSDEVISDLRLVKSHIDYPGITFQRALLKGLECDCSELNVISSPVITSFPRIKKVYFSRMYFGGDSRQLSSINYSGQINVPVVNMLSKFLRVRYLLKMLLKIDSNADVIIYALHSPFLLAATLLRSRINKLCVVVPDLPEYMNGNISGVVKVGKLIDRKIIDYCLKSVDCFVLLSPFMKEKLAIQGKKWIQLEGIYDASLVDYQVEKDPNKVILYTGNISAKYNIIELLDAFGLIDDPNYRLWIRGNGDTELEIKRRAQIDNRIVYFDRMSKDELTILQKRATLLINPVFSSNEFTKYFFPSKTMEYLASGTPVLMCDLPCLPNEYKAYLYLIKDETPSGIKKMIKEICEKPSSELEEKGMAGAKFIREQKNARIQAGRIVSLLESLQ